MISDSVGTWLSNGTHGRSPALQRLRGTRKTLNTPMDDANPRMSVMVEIVHILPQFSADSPELCSQDACLSGHSLHQVSCGV